MSPNRRERIEALFESALEQPPSERAGWLAGMCADESELYAEVMALLAAHEQAEGLLDRDAVQVAASLIGDPTLGERIGPYRIVGELGRGGMGVVYLGERDDGVFRRRVAIKVIRAGADAAEMHRRFQAERQILASLEHPNIAHLLDGGLTGDGRQYLVLEYIEGLPIDTYCRQLPCSIEDRLRLFCSVARTVHHAHRSLVVHRDLKPSNILVTEDGTIKLLDFGIAKILDPTALGQTGPVTRTGLRLMTPEYASPEQVSGGTITTATDVYQLGVVLYELLTGQRPYSLKGCSAGEIERIIMAEEPKRPSTIVGRGLSAAESNGRSAVASGDGRLPAYAHDDAWAALPIDAVGLARQAERRQRSRRLRGDLDRIVLMALRKEPQRRYSSAEAMAEDIERHLDGRPVIAQRDSPGYRARKFVTRHRWGITAAAAVAVALLGGLAGVAWQAQRAEGEAEKVARVAGLMLDIFRLSDPTEALGDTITARQILDQGAERILSEFGDQPDVQAAMLGEVAQVYANLGHLTRSEQLLRQSLALREDLHGPNSLEVSESLSRLGQVLATEGRRQEAIDHLRRSVEIRSAALPTPDSLLAETQVGLAWQIRSQGHYEDAGHLFAQALETQRALFGDESPLVASTLFGLASARHDGGRFDEAEELFERALARFNTSQDRPHPMAATAFLQVGMIRRIRQQHAAAEPLLESALAMRSALYDADHPDVIEAKSEWGVLLRDLGRYREAERVLGEGLESANRTLGYDHAETGTIRERYTTVLTRLGRYAESIARMDTALAVKRARTDGNPAYLLAALLRAGEPLLLSGRLDEAEARFSEALSLAGERGVYTVVCLEALGNIELARGNYDVAESLFDEALSIAGERLSEGHRYTLSVRRSKARLLVRRGRVDEAVASLLDVLRSQLTTWREPHANLGRTLLWLGEAYLVAGRAAQAEAVLRRASTNFGEIPSGHWLSGEAKSLRGAALMAQGRRSEAETLLSEGLRVIRAHVGPSAPQARRAEARVRGNGDSVTN
ncbi:MAG: tetratricopeptide repeat protein [Gemmatimonadetes bacterium]|nr:tetratricopeptide repeat protein [Gemmatimonadota bacterium]NIO31687.1 tetratricopeptide repeat protein [Gemmatimonadota bacterium]